MAASCPKSEWPSHSGDSKSPTLGRGQGRLDPVSAGLRLASPDSSKPITLSDLRVGGWQRGPQGAKASGANAPGQSRPHVCPLFPVHSTLLV